MMELFKLCKNASVRPVEGSKNKFKIGGQTEDVNSFIKKLKENKKIKLLSVENPKRSISEDELNEKIREIIGGPGKW